MPKIVIVDTDFENNDFEVRMAKDAGVDIALFNEREPEAIIRNAADADGVVTSYGKFPPKVFEALPNLRVVSRTGIGYDDIDVPAATKNGTAVCVVPGYGTEVVSDHAITLALCVLRRLNETDADMRAQVFGTTRAIVRMVRCSVAYLAWWEWAKSVVLLPARLLAWASRWRVVRALLRRVAARPKATTSWSTKSY